MAVKERKVIMNGNDWGVYKIRFGTMIKLRCIRLYLWGLRWVRRFKRGWGYCKYAAVVVPFWAVYMILVYLWGNQRLAEYPVDNLLWDLKSNLFASVILAIVTAFLTKYRKSKNMFDERNHVYHNIMDCSSSLYKDLLVLLCHDGSKRFVPFWPFYTKKSRRTIYSEFRDTYGINRTTKEYKHVIHSVSVLRRELNTILQLSNNGIVSDSDRFRVNNLISACAGGLNNIERLLLAEDNYPHWNVALSFLAGCLFDLIDYIREPWRRDEKLKILALKLIYAEDKNVAGTYYNSAFLDVVDDDFYVGVDNYIEKLHKTAAGNRRVVARKKIRDSAS